MCKKCSHSRLTLLCVQLHSQNQGDIAIKFGSFAEIVLRNTYDPDATMNGSLQKRMLDLAISFGQGYVSVTLREFKAKLNQFTVPIGETRIRQGMVNAMEELFNIYGNRLPWALYGGYMFMVTRPNMHVAERLPDLKKLLPVDLPWECIDAVWHGLPPATSLYLHILAVINRHTGTVPLHGCGCNHYLPPVRREEDPRMGVLYPEPDNIRMETEVPVSHMLLSIESLVRGLPQAIGETDKSLYHSASKATDLPVAMKVLA